MQNSPFKSKQEKAKEESLDIILRAIVSEPNDEQIEARKASFKTARELAEAIDLSNLINNATIDPRIIYCNLTGQPIGERHIRNLKMALHVRGKTQAEELIEYGAQTAIADWWIGVSGESLNRLAELDPCGYYVYAASIAFQHNFKQFFNKKANPKDAINNVQILKQKIALFHKLQELPITEVIKANEAWRDFLSLIDPAYLAHNILFPCKVLADFGERELVININKYLKTIIANLLSRAEMSRYTYRDVVLVREKYKGISVFGEQTRLANMSHEEGILRILQQVVGHGPINKSAKLPNVKPKKYVGDIHTTKVSADTKLEIKVTTLPQDKPKKSLAEILAETKNKKLK